MLCQRAQGQRLAEQRRTFVCLCIGRIDHPACLSACLHVHACPLASTPRVPATATLDSLCCSCILGIFRAFRDLLLSLFATIRHNHSLLALRFLLASCPYHCTLRLPGISHKRSAQSPDGHLSTGHYIDRRPFRHPRRLSCQAACSTPLDIALSSSEVSRLVIHQPR